MTNDLSDIDFSGDGYRHLAKLKEFGCQFHRILRHELNFILVEHETGDEYIDPEEQDVEQELEKIVHNFIEYETIYNPNEL
jgi:hypothetical protein